MFDERISNLSLIFAVDQNGVIGKDGDIPWHSKHDFAWFKEKTLTKRIIMGRKTWDSLPVKPLPNRHNTVISKQPQNVVGGNGYAPTFVATSLEIAIKHALTGNLTEIFVIGGKGVLEQAAKYASDAYISRIGVATPVDENCVMAPVLPPYELIEEFTIFEGDESSPSVKVEHIRFL